MKHLNDLPKRSKSHKTEIRAEDAFQRCLADSDDFFVQISDRKDYGTDYQIEVDDQDQATNVRVHVQLKGTEKALNSDGSISVEVHRTNLNYLLMYPYSFYVCYHSPSESLWICFAENVLRQYEHRDKIWSDQTTLTVKFLDPLTNQRLKRVAALAKSGATSLRDKRVVQTTASAEDIPSIMKQALPDFHMPEDAPRATDLLSNLYQSGADELISACFGKFAAVFGLTHDAMITCYMAEINLGMAGKSSHPARIEAGIAQLESRLDGGRYHVGSTHYSIGNGLLALGRESDAIVAYESSLQNTLPSEGADHLAQCYKNMGSSFEKLGDDERAIGCFREALQINPNLAEAHFALGSHYHRTGQFEEALHHFDLVVFPDGTLGEKSSIAGWRINVLFNLGDGRGAFREINGLLGDADSEDWVWPWCARQVAGFGRTTVENARASIAFWARYLGAHSDCSLARRETLLAKLYLRSNGEGTGASYEQFKVDFEANIEQFETDDVAFLWDRLGHWAQDEENWTEAERCFRKAFVLEGGHYGYCLGTALNFLGRCEESLPILQKAGGRDST